MKYNLSYLNEYLSSNCNISIHDIRSFISLIENTALKGNNIPVLNINYNDDLMGPAALEIANIEEKVNNKIRKILNESKITILFSELQSFSAIYEKAASLYRLYTFAKAKFDALLRERNYAITYNRTHDDSKMHVIDRPDSSEYLQRIREFDEYVESTYKPRVMALSKFLIYF